MGVHENGAGLVRFTGRGDKFSARSMIRRFVTWLRARSPAPASKREDLERLLAHGAVLIHLDARRPGVVVPAQHATDPTLVLRIGYRLAPPIDLVCGEHAISCTLQFAGVPVACTVPWSAIYAAIREGDPNGKVWHADIPPEASARMGVAVEPARIEAHPKDKWRRIDMMMAQGRPVLVHLDASCDGVVVPESCRSEHVLVLRIGRVSPPIVDLATDEDGWSGTLLFAGEPFLVIAPWHAVYAATIEGSGELTTWRSELPRAQLR